MLIAHLELLRVTDNSKSRFCHLTHKYIEEKTKTKYKFREYFFFEKWVVLADRYSATNKKIDVDFRDIGDVTALCVTTTRIMAAGCLASKSLLQ